MTLRPLRRRDATAWREIRQVNAAWLGPWDATQPPSAGQAPASFPAMVRSLNAAARRGQSLPFVVEVAGQFVGQVTVNNIVRGSAQFANVGYWIDRRYAGQGVIPLAVAMVIDHLFAEWDLHRVEIAVRPENSASLRVVEKLGLREIGFAPRYLHIDGGWRDHRLYAVTVEEAPVGGFVARVVGDR